MTFLTPFLAAWVLTAAPSAEPRRWAVVIGENTGLPEEERLHFAERDAERMLGALREVGGVSADTSVALLGTDATRLRSALASFGKRLASEAAPRDWLYVYVSSHAGEGALHLRGGELPLSELLAFAKAAPVAVSVLVVDSCQSGVLTRLKGLRPAPPAVNVQAAELEGRIVITSSGADEYAQESEELQGSFFTHHLVTGLRGAADASGDGRVSLEEAYSYAYARTVESTLGSRGGLQRASFHTDLRGHGELVVSEPAHASGRLTLAVEAPGQWTITAERGGALVAELEKGPGPTTLALLPGAYKVRLRGSAGVLERTVVVPATGGAIVRGEELERAAEQRVAAKGFRRQQSRVALGANASSGLVRGVPYSLGLQLEAAREVESLGPIDVVILQAAVRTARSQNVGFDQREVELAIGAGPAYRLGPMELMVAAAPGAIVAIQSNLPDGTTRVGLEPFVDAAGSARWRFAGGFAVWARLAAGAVLVRTDEGTSLLPRASGGLGFGAQW